MKVSVTIRRIFIEDMETGEAYIVPTNRTIDEIYDLIKKAEQDGLAQKISEVVWEAHHQHVIEGADNEKGGEKE